MSKRECDIYIDEDSEYGHIALYLILLGAMRRLKTEKKTELEKISRIYRDVNSHEKINRLI